MRHHNMTVGLFFISGCVAATHSCRRGPSHTLVKSTLKQVGADFLCLRPLKYSHPLRKLVSTRPLLSRLPIQLEGGSLGHGR